MAALAFRPPSRSFPKADARAEISRVCRKRLARCDSSSACSCFSASLSTRDSQPFTTHRAMLLFWSWLTSGMLVSPASNSVRNSSTCSSSPAARADSSAPGGTRLSTRPASESTAADTAWYCRFLSRKGMAFSWVNLCASISLRCLVRRPESTEMACAPWTVASLAEPWATPRKTLESSRWTKRKAMTFFRSSSSCSSFSSGMSM
mmetsp:Transcript_43742/g.130646  ORF Transcript_43742/g.130646 Transcript_43742/m.130646 type:complete len:205 (-) Transcript_43742:416-1030(-)